MPGRLALFVLIVITFIIFDSDGFRFLYNVKGFPVRSNHLHNFPAKHHIDLSPEIESLRSDLLKLCDEYKELEETLLKSGVVKSPRKLRDVPSLRYIEDRITLKILQLSTKSPIPDPFSSWGSKNLSAIDGSWKLRFTTAIDAKPEISNTKRSSQTISTYQYVNSSSQEITNIIRSFSTEDQSIISTLKVSVKGKALSANRLQLSFNNVNVERPKAKFLKRFNFPFPRIPFINAWVNYRNQKRSQKTPVGPFFDIVYLDEDLRIHKTGRGDYFIQSRIYDVWDPMVGWKQISVI